MEVPRKVVSRRARPAKAPLSQQQIVATALELLASEGLHRVSLRQVAAALDTGPASLYVYFPSLTELQATMLDTALQQVRLPKRKGTSWQARLRSILLSYREALMKHPGLGLIAISTIPSGPSSVRIWEAILDALAEGGLDMDRAAWALDQLLLHVTAIAAEQSAQGTHAEGVAQLQQTLARISPSEHPRVHAARRALVSGNGRSRQDWGITALIEGVAVTARES